jgi:hypothetical protein
MVYVLIKVSLMIPVNSISTIPLFSTLGLLYSLKKSIKETSINFLKLKRKLERERLLLSILLNDLQIKN